MQNKYKNVRETLPWRACGCGRCGCIWDNTGDFFVLSVNKSDDETGQYITEEFRQEILSFIVESANKNQTK